LQLAEISALRRKHDKIDQISGDYLYFGVNFYQMENIKLRKETPADFRSVEELTREALNCLLPSYAILPFLDSFLSLIISGSLRIPKLLS